MKRKIALLLAFAAFCGGWAWDGHAHGHAQAGSSVITLRQQV